MTRPDFTRLEEISREIMRKAYVDNTFRRRRATQMQKERGQTAEVSYGPGKTEVRLAKPVDLSEPRDNLGKMDQTLTSYGWNQTGKSPAGMARTYEHPDQPDHTIETNVHGWWGHKNESGNWANTTSFPGRAIPGPGFAPPGRPPSSFEDGPEQLKEHLDEFHGS